VNDYCTSQYTCASITKGQATSNICYPVVTPGNFCNATVDYNPCEKGFFCNKTRGTCDFSSTTNQNSLNDGCLEDKYCGSGLYCSNKVCKLPAGITNCTGNHQCGWNQFCNFTVPFDQSKCINKPGAGESCTGQCKFGLYCSQTSNTTTACMTYMTVAEGGKCASVFECKSGLECYQQVCTKPSYHFLGAAGGAAWGPDCDPNDGAPGCTCNYASKMYMYLKEVSITLPENLVNLYKDFDKCMSDNGCTSVNTGYDSCLRKKCYAVYNILLDTASYPQDTLRPPHCGASGFILMTIAMIVLMLL